MNDSEPFLLFALHNKLEMKTAEGGLSSSSSLLLGSTPASFPVSVLRGIKVGLVLEAWLGLSDVWG